MEASQALPPEGLRATDLEKIWQAEGPFLSVYLTTEGEIENAAHRSEQRWRTLRATLEERNVSAAILDAVDLLVSTAHQRGGSLAVVAAEDGGILHVEHGPTPPIRDVGVWDALPRLGPVVEWRQSIVPYVVVLADRRGADLSAFSPSMPDLHMETEPGPGPDRKVGPGGWSQRRYQQRVENSWEENAAEIAVQVTRLVEATEARLVVVAGDVRTVALLRGELPERVAALVEEVAGGRTLDGSRDAIAEDVARLVDVTAARRTGEVLTRFSEERGQGDAAADGVAAVFAALSRGQVEQLLVHDDLDDDRRAWFGPEPPHIATSREDLERFGVERPREGRLVDVAIRAGLGTGAGIRIIPPEVGVRDGLGALLRFAP